MPSNPKLAMDALKTPKARFTLSFKFFFFRPKSNEIWNLGRINFNCNIIADSTSFMSLFKISDNLVHWFLRYYRQSKTGS